MSSDADDGLVQGPDFPTGGIIVDSRDSILEAYKTGRGGFRVRARWETGRPGPGHLERSSSPKFPIRCRRRG